MPTAVHVADPPGFMGEARAFRVDPSIRNPANGREYDHVTISKLTVGGPRVEVYGAHPTGHAQSMFPLPGSFVMQHDVSVDDACVWALLTAGGYVITEPEPEPEVAEGIAPDEEAA